MRWTIAVVAVAALWLGEARADPHKRIVVLPFAGPHAAALHRDALDLLDASDATAAWAREVERLSPTKLTRRTIQQLAKQLAVDAIVSGTVEDGRVRLALRDGSSGRIVARRVARTADLRVELARLIDGAPPPLRVAVECASADEVRTKACPAFLLGFVDGHDVLRAAPRADADVIVYATITEVALADRVHLRFVASVPGAPPVVETDVALDTRADDDTQREQLEPSFLRGIALYVAARHPEAVAVTLGASDAASDGDDASPWDIKLDLGGSGNWSDQYQLYTGTTTLGIARLSERSRAGIALHADGGVDHRPALVLPDGRAVSVDTRQWRLGATLDGAWLVDDHWSLGVATTASRDDPDGQYDYMWATSAGIEWDRYAANDPRGNRLAIRYTAGYQLDRYHLRDVLGERAAQYAIHQVTASGSVREDRISIGVAVSLGAELLEPARRNHVSAAPFIDWKLGAHVDLELALTITRRELPAPDPAQISPTDYALLSRLSYAEPLAINGSLSISLHADRTNGARNDRFTDL